MKENILRQQRYTRRIYIILLSLSAIIIIVFTSITGQTSHLNMKSTSLHEFIQLYDQYPLTLSCPCNQTTIDRKLPLNIQLAHREICSSQYVSSDWINLQFKQISSRKSFTRDIRSQWQIHLEGVGVDPGGWMLDDVNVYYNSTQLIINGGFETSDLTGWTWSGTCNVNVGQAYYGSNYAHNGNYYYYDPCAGDNHGDTLQQTFSTIIGQTYFISFWLTNYDCCSTQEIANITIY